MENPAHLLIHPLTHTQNQTKKTGIANKKKRIGKCQTKIVSEFGRTEEMEKKPETNATNFKQWPKKHCWRELGEGSVFFCLAKMFQTQEKSTIKKNKKKTR